MQRGDRAAHRTAARGGGARPPTRRDPLDNCDWNTSGPTSGHVESELRAHVSRTHGLDIDSLKPDVRERVLAAIADA